MQRSAAAMRCLAEQPASKLLLWLAFRGIVANREADGFRAFLLPREGKAIFARRGFGTG